jgi:WhiB family redox-sensing transcriptional regulator
MPDGITPGVAELLSPQLLADAASDTRRRWSVHALCATSDPEMFFPPGDSPAAGARQICAQCPVRRQCLAYAVAAGEPHGIWGGLDPDERRSLRRRLLRKDTATAVVDGITA